MPSIPLESIYDGVLSDDAVNLALGSTVITTTLAVELSATEEEVCYLASTAGAEPHGSVRIDSELFFYESLLGSSQVLELRRGQEGTPAIHLVSAVATIYGQPRFGNPAVPAAIQIMQGDLVAMKAVKKYVALLSQSGTDAPVATVIENTLGGTVVWRYEDEALYLGELSGAFVANKTWAVISNGDAGGGVYARYTDVDTVAVRASGDSVLIDAALEIRVYP